ncbi:hypothetical protein A3D77_05375 [Candidatus Gottesmanbacteria bacterium RIFCSPHIGHO2_02_FULL_39_11]|uniref:SH3b domain-containing protein n=1 Tax=Candidatus Gottesmanbacteria bacterium RIFCSPHIGHO2_02_FULL_39_11 TaxID=1798382 RepID=A0A1F5ZLQ7_9BACT|nr:MAG: hypothetical protein A3D77_05375 [Candidatus Gottesmanbacteria bacterium RIFCSPHIGHO2_02_FULL_39_11]
MNQKIIGLAIILVLIGLGIFAFITFKARSISRLNVMSNPGASVFLNEKLVGKTPYLAKQPAGVYTIKLVPDADSPDASTWQGKVTLKAGYETYVKRDLGASEVSSGGEIVSIDKIGETDSEISVSSSPDAVTILLDGQERGVSPQLFRNVTEGDHDVTLTSPGYTARTVRAQAIPGHKVSVEIQLALSAEAQTQTASDSGQPTSSSSTSTGANTTQVTIKDTPTGFLRVRSGPSLSASETAQVKPGEKYPYLDESDGWYKITIDGGEGWIAARYADKSK